VIFHPGWMTARHKQSFYVSRTALILNALMGNIEVPGGCLLAKPPQYYGRKGLRRLTDRGARVTEPAVGSRGYARRGALDVPPPPWRSEDVQLDAFYLHGDLAALQRLCDRSFNAPSGGQMQFRPVTRYVVLTFQRLHNLRSQAPGCETLGTLNYCEAAFWVFVQQYDREGDKVGGTVLAIPYIFAQNSLAVAAGREIYGFPKEYATVAMPEREAAADLYTVRAAALRTLSVGASVEPDCEILRCARVGGRPDREPLCNDPRS